MTELQKEVKYFEMPLWQRFAGWLWSKKWRFIFMGLTTYGWQYFKISQKWNTWKDSVKRKYRRRYRHRFNYSSTVFISQEEVLFWPEQLQHDLVVRLQKMFMELDKELDCGVSRQLILDCYKRMGLYQTQEA